MKDNAYKAAFDSVKFSKNFEQDTIGYLRRAADSKTQKEITHMNKFRIFKTAAIAVALVVVLSVSAFAVWTLLSPKEAAAQAGNKTLAEAFDSKDAITVNQSAQAGDYTVTLGGIVSGKGLTDYCEEAQADKSYIVASVAYTDGREITQAGETGFSFTPLVAGYKPWQVNAWTLGGSYYSFIYEGVNYYIFECSNIEIFADHEVYLAAYEGNAPGADIFTMDGDGDISYADGFKAPHAIFTLPLDEAKADPAAVKNLIEASGIIIQ